MRRTGFFLAVMMFVVTMRLHAQCGVERWSVKTGTDPDAPSVNIGAYTSTTIYSLQSSARPSSLPANNRVAPREVNQYRISATLKKYKRESDSDYHLVVQDSAGRTMIVELPSINCVGSGSPFGPGIRNARAQFDAKLTATSSFKTVTAPVTLRGVGFWDFLHGQTGVAPNGIEIHPVLDIAFTGPITASEPGTVSEASHPAVQLPADMVEDNDGGRAHVFRSGDPLADVLFHGGPVVEQPRIRIVFAGSFDDATKTEILTAARGLSADSRFDELARYGVRTEGMSIEARDLSDERGARFKTARLLAGNIEASPISGAATDLDVQRLLSTAVERGQIQHLDENVVTIVIVDRDATLAVGTTTDWQSYHSLFHPTELAMPYVVVRAGSDVREAMFASVARALINPDGNGWF